MNKKYIVVGIISVLLISILSVGVYFIAKNRNNVENINTVDNNTQVIGNDENKQENKEEIISEEDDIIENIDLSNYKVLEYNDDINNQLIQDGMILQEYKSDYGWTSDCYYLIDNNEENIFYLQAYSYLYYRDTKLLLQIGSEPVKIELTSEKSINSYRDYINKVKSLGLGHQLDGTYYVICLGEEAEMMELDYTEEVKSLTYLENLELFGLSIKDIEFNYTANLDKNGISKEKMMNYNIYNYNEDNEVKNFFDNYPLFSVITFEIMQKQEGYYDKVELVVIANNKCKRYGFINDEVSDEQPSYKTLEEEIEWLRYNNYVRVNE